MEFVRSDFLQNRGKSGSGTSLLYLILVEYEVIYLITAFQKRVRKILQRKKKRFKEIRVKSLREEAAKNRR